MMSPIADGFSANNINDQIGILKINLNREIISYNNYTAFILDFPSTSIVGEKYTNILPIIPSIELFVKKKKTEINAFQFKLDNARLSFTTICVDKDNNLVGLLEQQEEVDHNHTFANLSMKKILDSCLDEIFITDGEGNIVFVNSAGEALYGVAPKTLIGKTVFELEEKGYFSPSLFPIVKKRGEKVSMIQRTKMGKTTHCIAYPTFNENGELINIIFNARDITEIRYLREKIERSSALIDTYQSELKELQNFQEENDSLIALAPNMRKIKKMIDKIAPFDTTILITGESGVGKGVITHAIHEKSNRKDEPFVHINCGAIPESLIESELFGYEGGAFTGAKKEGQKGLIEQADKGTLFLDEIGEIPLHLQVKLLKVLQERQFKRVGGSKTIKVDIRVIAATNQNLSKLVEDGKFREDLYYRLNVIPIHIPPLHTRPEDISHMLDHYVKKFNDKYNLSTYLSLEAENILLRYNWPGNVRELENLIERLVVTAEKNEIMGSDLPSNILYLSKDEYAVSVKNIVTLKQAQEQMEEQLIRKAYEVDTSSYKVANMLGINQSTAHRKINQYLKNE